MSVAGRQFIKRVTHVMAVLAIVVGFLWAVWKVGNHMTWEDGLVYEHRERPAN